MDDGEGLAAGGRLTADDVMRWWGYDGYPTSELVGDSGDQLGLGCA